MESFRKFRGLDPREELKSDRFESRCSGVGGEQLIRLRACDGTRQPYYFAFLPLFFSALNFAQRSLAALDILAGLRPGEAFCAPGLPRINGFGNESPDGCSQFLTVAAQLHCSKRHR